MIKSNKKGFTLVELVVVVAVLLILAAIAIPTVSGVINQAQTATDSANAKSIETAIKYAIAQNEITNATTYADIGDALALSGMVDAILIPRSQGMVFAYAPLTDTITVVAGTVDLAPTTAIS